MLRRSTDRVKYARSVRKDRGLNILQYEKQTRMINSLLYATANFTNNLQRIFRRYSEKVFFKNLDYSENFRYIFVQLSIVFSVLPLFAEGLLVAGLRMGIIYEDQQIHTKTASRRIRLEYSQSDPHTNRMACDDRFYYCVRLSDLHYSTFFNLNPVWESYRNKPLLF